MTATTRIFKVVGFVIIKVFSTNDEYQPAGETFEVGAKDEETKRQKA